MLVYDASMVLATPRQMTLHGLQQRRSCNAAGAKTPPVAGIKRSLRRLASPARRRAALHRARARRRGAQPSLTAMEGETGPGWPPSTRRP